MKTIMKAIMNAYRIFIINIKDLFYDLKYCGFYKDKESKISWRILLLAHSLEKGLSNSNKKERFGEGKARDLHRYLILYKERKDYVFNEGLSVLNSYIDYRKENNLSYKEFEINEEMINFPEGGVTLLNKEDVKYDFHKFEELCGIRHSVREYSDNYVKEYEIEKAVNLAKTAPSACNRQMIKVYCSDDVEINCQLSKLIPGNTGFKEEKTKFLFLTADRNAFDYYELDQWYMNGGIFVAYLQLAFAAEQVGSCIYQWPKVSKINKMAKELLDIPKNEIIVSVLGVGHYRDNFNVLKATRKELEDILVKREKR